MTFLELVSVLIKVLFSTVAFFYSVKLFTYLFFGSLAFKLILILISLYKKMRL